MGLPQAREARPFYQIALQRFIDAEHLFDAERYTGAVYLAGYGVECIFKALIITETPKNLRTAAVERFRGRIGHDLDRLRAIYFPYGRPTLTKRLVACFLIASSWSTNLRYSPGVLSIDFAQEFLAATDEIMTWAKGRM